MRDGSDILGIVPVGIYGDTGMVGTEISALLSRHGGTRIVFRRNSKRTEGSVRGCAVVFLATKDAESMRFAREAVDAGARVIDMSGAFRLNRASFEKWYGIKHTETALLNESVYGMPALFAKDIAAARVVANPGCYPTSVILALRPLSEHGLVCREAVIVATSGNSGARREIETESNEISYSFGTHHKHVPEMNKYSGFDVDFTPIVLRSVFRGINTNIRVALTAELRLLNDEDARDRIENAIADAYTPDDLVRVVRDTDEHSYGTHDVNETNMMLVKVRVGNGFAYISSMLDNLFKGAAGQAVENMNIMLGFPRLRGLI